MVGYYNPSVILTYVGLIFSVIGIFQSFGGNIKAALICLMISGICDMFDGSIARKVKRDKYAKSFGVQIDSLCDLVCFGVAPAVLAYCAGVKELGVIGISILCFYVLAGVIRLGYYNVLEEVNKDNNTTSCGFRGVPITTSALVVPMFKLIDVMTGLVNSNIMMAIVMLMLGLGFIINIPIRKPAKLGKVVLVFIGLVVFLSLIKYGSKI